MSHFSNEKTEIELFVVENFNYDDENPYTSQIEEEGEFVQISPIQEKETIDDDSILNNVEQANESGR